jgi:predicted ATPase with chaperone activity
VIDEQQNAGGDLDGFLGRLAALAENSGGTAGHAPSAPPSVGTVRPRSPLRGEEIAQSRRGVAAPAVPPDLESNEGFFPLVPESLADAHISESEVEAIILRLLLHCGKATGLEIAQQVALPFGVVQPLLASFKTRRFLAIRGSAALSDYVYEITDAGLQRARRHAEQCTYFGAAPVALSDYRAGVAAQSLQRTPPRIEDLRRAFADLTLSANMFARLGRAITSGRGLFLYGQPGNGKTSIAERITAVFGSSIWIPRAISAWGEIIRFYDPSCHVEVPLATSDRILQEEKRDLRWVRIRRPTIVVGGELTMDSLEIVVHKDTGVSEAPIQMKSNCGTLVIDDFGRQRILPATLLNRWIVPLEKRHDYLALASGRKIRVPFDQFIVFSTNLDPKDLVDEAFLRRIPYKIDVENPTVEEFRQLFSHNCQTLGIAYRREVLDHLIATHYEATGRQMRFCHSRDLLHQVAIYCKFHEWPAEMSIEAIDAAAEDYFSMV